MPGCLSKCNSCPPPLASWMNSRVLVSWMILLPHPLPHRQFLFSSPALCCLVLTLQMAGLVLWCCCIFQGQVLPRSLSGSKCQGSALVSWEISFKIMANGKLPGRWHGMKGGQLMRKGQSGEVTRFGLLWLLSLTFRKDKSHNKAMALGFKAPFLPLGLAYSPEKSWAV